jgi:putative Mg2+ transporter-C (MgtC) family protein
MLSYDLLLRLVIACVVGAVLGFEREYLSKSAGFRTLILISLGSCLFTIFSILISKETPDRVAANIVTGIGFLGAGVIFKEENRVKGLTTAATIWITAALGMGSGGGYFALVIIGCLIALVVLFILIRVEEVIDKMHQNRNYRIVCIYKQETLERYERMFEDFNLRHKREREYKSGENIIGEWIVSGSEKNHDRFIQELIKDERVKEFAF